MPIARNYKIIPLDVFVDMDIEEMDLNVLMLMNATEIHVMNLPHVEIQEDRINVLVTKDTWEMDIIAKKCGCQIRDVELLIAYQMAEQLNVILKVSHLVVQHMVIVASQRNTANVRCVMTIAKDAYIMTWILLPEL